MAGIQEWGGAFSIVRGPDRAVCLRMKATTKFACVAKLVMGNRLMDSVR